MILLGKAIVLIFGLFLIFVGFLMLFAPEKARETLRKAGSTPLINYTEITVRMIPAFGLILCAEAARFPEVFRLLGWFMLATSFVLYFVPRDLHHQFSLRAADFLKPHYFQWISPFSMLFGSALIYGIS